ncbi:MAG: hypothetical protein GY944_08590, partial [bacterium]|nr:hypothetical protein [bacterium]
MPNIAAMGIEPGKDRDGIWISYLDGIYLRVGRMWSPRFQECYEEEKEALQARYGSEIPEEPQADSLFRATAKGLLFDWVFVNGRLADDLTPLDVPARDFTIAELAKATDERKASIPTATGAFKVREVEFEGAWYRIEDPIPSDETREEGEDPPPSKGIEIVRYSPELGARLFKDERYEDIYRTVRTLSLQQERFALEAVEAS